MGHNLTNLHVLNLEFLFELLFTSLFTYFLFVFFEVLVVHGFAEKYKIPMKPLAGTFISYESMCTNIMIFETWCLLYYRNKKKCRKENEKHTFVSL